MVKWKQLKKQWWKTLKGSPKKNQFFKLEARKFHFLKYKKLFKSRFFLLFKLGKLLPEIVRNFFGVSVSWNINIFFRVSVFWNINIFFGVSVFWNIKIFFEVSVFWNIKKTFSWENIINFLILESESSLFSKYKKFSRCGFF